MTQPRILFYVQYLEGIGHVVRAGRIAEELCRSGCEVTLVLGGPPIPGFAAAAATLHQLPPLTASPTSYSRLLKADGTPVDDAYKTDRRDRLLALFKDYKPDVVITEAYPMGRWAMDFELIPLLDGANATKPRPMIVASLRDILQMPKTSQKSDRSIAVYKQYYDHMLVHGDPNLVRIEESFPPIAGLRQEPHYTGLVTPDQAGGNDRNASSESTFDVIVSGGGGAIGYSVLAAAINAKPATTLSDARWLALAGPRMPPEQLASLATLANANNVQLERFRADLVKLMTGAKLSIQRAGYNTVADLLRAGCRAVLVPDAADRQMEQPLRAQKLATLGRAVVVDESGLTPEKMAFGIDEAMSLQPPELAFNLEGAANAARCILSLFAAHKTA